MKRFPISDRAARAAATATLRREGAESAMLSFAFVGRATMMRLNRSYIGRRSATDVLSFGLDGAGEAGVVADIYICPDVARENARRLGISIREELLRLVVHGVLHALGNDHPEDERRSSSPMWRKQESILAGIV